MGESSGARQMQEGAIGQRAVGEGRGQVIDIRRNQEGEVKGYAVYQVKKTEGDKKTELMEVQELSLDELLKQEEKLLFKNEEDKLRALEDLKGMREEQNMSQEEYSRHLGKVLEAEYIESREREAKDAMRAGEKTEVKEVKIYNTLEEVINARNKLEDEAETGRMSWEDFKNEFIALNAEYIRLKEEDFKRREVEENLRAAS